jgi:nitrate/nitrite transporter NarK
VGAGVYSTIVTVPFLIMPALPKNQPSATAGAERTPFLKGCRALFSSINFWYLMIIFCMVMGIETSILTLLTPIMLPYGYTNNQAGITGFVRLFSGFVAGTITGPLIDKTGQHLLILRLFVPLLCLTYLMIYIQSKILRALCEKFRNTCMLKFYFFLNSTPQCSLGVQYGKPFERLVHLNAAPCNFGVGR